MEKISQNKDLIIAEFIHIQDDYYREGMSTDSAWDKALSDIIAKYGEESDAVKEITLKLKDIV